MKYLLVLAALVVAAQGLGKWREGLSVRFGLSLLGARNYFVDVPQTLTAAKNKRWVQSTRPEGQPIPRLVLYNPSINDVVLGAFYETDGGVAGIQIAIPKADYTDAVFDWAELGYSSWTAPANSAGVQKEYWTNAVYFVSENGTKSNSRTVLREDHIYITSFNGELMPISTVAEKVADTASTYFTRQACIPAMGRHYYYNMTVLTECTSKGFLPWFPMVDQSSDTNQLIAVGYMNFGKLPERSLTKDYFERPTKSNVQLIVPSGPQCLYDLAGTKGVVSMHIYFVDSPATINCLFT